ncbi:MAG: hypothetical protein ACK56V_12170, partial [Bacteroidota bacterium]
AREAVIVVVTPTGGMVTYDKNKMLIANRIVDYSQSKVTFKSSPRSKALESQIQQVEKGKSCAVFCAAEDADSPTLTYKWSTDLGSITGTNKEVLWKAPQTNGKSAIKVVVRDEDGNEDSLSIVLEVVNEINKAPVIENLFTSKLYAGKNETIVIDCFAKDENGDSLVYT